MRVGSSELVMSAAPAAKGFVARGHEVRIGSRDEEGVSPIIKDFGWTVHDIGGIEASRYLEPMCLVWVRSAVRVGHSNQAFKLLRK